jgi:hypothetical protein
MSDEVADILAAAREIIEKDGWIRHELMDGPSVCSVGGMLVALDLGQECVYDSRILEACTSLAEVVCEDDPQIRFHGHHADGKCHCVVNWITTWNDDVAEDSQQVLDAFAKAEKIERAGFDPDAA